MARRKLVAGNWKMNGLRSDLGEVEAIARAAAATPEVDVALCLPATLIEAACRLAPDLAIGGQDVHPERSGPYTGGVSAAMLIDSGARLTIVGHSERREACSESDSVVRAKAETAIAAGLRVILCCGESLDVHDAGRALATVSTQLDNSLPRSDPARLDISYEPIWAIGTGRTPTLGEIAEMHVALRERLAAAYGSAAETIRILYGGSVKPSNAAGIFGLARVDGALVGGASLLAADFVPIIEAAARSA